MDSPKSGDFSTYRSVNPSTPPQQKRPSEDGMSPIRTPDIDRTPPTPRAPDMAMKQLTLTDKPPRAIELRPSLLENVEATPSATGTTLQPLDQCVFVLPGASTRAPKRRRFRHFIRLPGGKKLRMNNYQAEQLGLVDSET